MPNNGRNLDRTRFGSTAGTSSREAPAVPRHGIEKQGGCAGRDFFPRVLKEIEEAATYALLSLDSTMRSNVTVGPPIDLLAYEVDELEITRRRRFPSGDPDLVKIGVRWEQALRQAVARLPQIRFRACRNSGHPQSPQEETIQLVEPTTLSDQATDVRIQASQRPPA